MEAQLNNEYVPTPRDQYSVLSDLRLIRCAELRARIQQITDGEYASAKRDVDGLRAELGQPPLPSLQATLEEKSQQYAPPSPRNGGALTHKAMRATGTCKSVALVLNSPTSARRKRCCWMVHLRQAQNVRAGDRKGAKTGVVRYLAVAGKPSRRSLRKIWRLWVVAPLFWRREATTRTRNLGALYVIS
jgi:hypothetical protein